MYKERVQGVSNSLVLRGISKTSKDIFVKRTIEQSYLSLLPPFLSYQGDFKNMTIWNFPCIFFTTHAGKIRGTLRSISIFFLILHEYIYLITIFKWFIFM